MVKIHGRNYLQLVGLRMAKVVMKVIGSFGVAIFMSTLCHLLFYRRYRMLEMVFYDCWVRYPGRYPMTYSYFRENIFMLMKLCAK